MHDVAVFIKCKSREHIFPWLFDETCFLRVHGLNICYTFVMGDNERVMSGSGDFEGSADFSLFYVK